MTETITLKDATGALTALREAAQLPAQVFSTSEFVGMISDEIDALRSQGHSDESIATLVKTSSGIELNADELRTHYAPPEARERHG